MNEGINENTEGLKSVETLEKPGDNNESEAIEVEEKMPQEAEAFQKKLHLLHVEAQRIKLEITNLASCYHDANTIESNDSNPLVNFDFTKHTEEINRLLDWENIKSKEESSEGVLEIGGLVAEIKRYWQYFKNETQKLQVEYDRSRTEKKIFRMKLKNLKMIGLVQNCLL